MRTKNTINKEYNKQLEACEKAKAIFNPYPQKRNSASLFSMAILIGFLAVCTYIGLRFGRKYNSFQQEKPLIIQAQPEIQTYLVSYLCDGKLKTATEQGTFPPSLSFTVSWLTSHEGTTNINLLAISRVSK